MKIILGLFVIAVLAGGVWYAMEYQAAPAVEIEAQYEQKLVFTTSLDTPTGPLVEYCEDLGGTFNQCGSPCAPDAAACIEVCAYTCDNIPN